MFQLFFYYNQMIIYRLLIILYLLIIHTMTENLLISKDSIDVNVGKRVRMDCQLNNTLINENRKVKTIICFINLNKIYIFN